MDSFSQSIVAKEGGINLENHHTEDENLKNDAEIAVVVVTHDKFLLIFEPRT